MDPNGRTVSERVISRIADRTDTDPLELPRLSEAVDPDALDALVNRLADGEVSFRYAGYVVTVGHGGSVRLEDYTAGEESSGDADRR